MNAPKGGHRSGETVGLEHRLELFVELEEAPLQVHGEDELRRPAGRPARSHGTRGRDRSRCCSRCSTPRNRTSRPRKAWPRRCLHGAPRSSGRADRASGAPDDGLPARGRGRAPSPTARAASRARSAGTRSRTPRRGPPTRPGASRPRAGAGRRGRPREAARRGPRPHRHHRGRMPRARSCQDVTTARVTPRSRGRHPPSRGRSEDPEPDRL